MVLSSFVLVLAGAASASAITTHNLLSSFGSFSNVQSIAVDQANGDVYVLDAGAGAVYKFDAEGKPAEFSGLGASAIAGLNFGGPDESQIAVDSGAASPAKGDIYIAHAGRHVQIFGPDGLPRGELTEEVEKEAAAAVGTWGEVCGVATDPSGNVYVGLASGGTGHIDKFHPAADPVKGSDFVSTLSGFAGEVCNIAADASEAAYADIWSAGPISKYEALQFNTLGLPGAPAWTIPTGSTLAVDGSSGDLYSDENSQVTQYTPAGATVSTFGGGGPGVLSSSYGIAVDEASGEVYVSQGEGGVDVFGPLVSVADAQTGEATVTGPGAARFTGTVNPLGSDASYRFEYGTSQSYGQSAPASAVDVGSGSQPVAVSAEVSGLTPGATYYYRVVAIDASGSDYGQGRTVAIPPLPMIFKTWVTSAASASAGVAAQVWGRGLETEYHFEYGTSTAYGASAPAPDAHVADVERVQQVSWTLTGLQPQTVYHVRLAATGPGGTAYGPDTIFTTAAALGSGEEGSGSSCPNAALRTGYSAALPDCRAYEMVSPPDKNGGSITFNSTSVAAAAQGGTVVYGDRAGFGDAHGSGPDGVTFYRAARGGEGWSTHAITPYTTPGFSKATQGDNYLKFSEDLSAGLLTGAPPIPGVPAPQDIAADYHQSFGSESLQSLAPTNVAVPAFSLGPGATFRAGSADLSHILYSTKANLVAPASGSGDKLYEWVQGSTRVAGLLPGGEVAESGGMPDGSSNFPTMLAQQMVSADGSRVYFVDESGGQLYLRENGQRTVWASEPEAGLADPKPSRVRFAGANSDGSVAAFISEDQLVSQAPPRGNGKDLYLYRDGPSPQSEANLTLIDAGGAEGVLGVSADGGTVAFFAHEGELYLWRHGVTRLLGIFHPVAGSDALAQSRLTADGRYLVFGTQVPPSGVTNAGTGQQLYIYDAMTEAIRCISCDPTGAVTSGEARLDGGGVGLDFATMTRVRSLSSDSHFLFFNSNSALAPGDVNGVFDAYEYDIQTGKLALISSGSSPDDSFFLDASADGSESYFATDQPLVASDNDHLYDLYAAKIGGGYPEPSPPLAPCTGDACQGPPPTPPPAPFPGTFTFDEPPAQAAAAPSKPSAKTKTPVRKKPSAKKKRKKTAKKHVRKRRRSSVKRGRSR